MKILLLEDDASVAEALEGILQDLGHDVLYAYEIYEADEHLENEKIDFIISDLNMSSAGLNESELTEAEEGALSGFVWLKNHVYKVMPELRKNTIIFSAFSEHLNDHLEADYLNGVMIISKEVNLDEKAEQIINKIQKS